MGAAECVDPKAIRSRTRAGSDEIVIATSEALKLRQQGYFEGFAQQRFPQAFAPAAPAPAEPVVPVAQTVAPIAQPAPAAQAPVAQPGDVIQMRYVDEDPQNKAG